MHTKPYLIVPLPRGERKGHQRGTKTKTPTKGPETNATKEGEMKEGCPLDSVQHREQKGDQPETTMTSLEGGSDGPEQADFREEEVYEDTDSRDDPPWGDDPRPRPC